MRFVANSDYLYRSSGLPSYNEPYAFQFWAFCLAYNTAGNSVPFFLSDGGYANYDTLLIAQNTGVMSLETIVSSSQTTTSGSTFPLLRWVNLCISRESPTRFILWRDGLQDIVHTANAGTSRSASYMMYVSKISSFNRWFNGYISNPILWQRAPSQAEIQAQMRSYEVVNRGGLYGDWHGHSGAWGKDFSGNGNDWTTSGLADSPLIPIQRRAYSGIYLPSAGGGGGGLSVPVAYHQLQQQGQAA